MISASAVVDLQTVPLWFMWLLGLAGIATIFLVAARILPPALRWRRWGIWVFAAALFCARAALSRDSRGVLWFGGVLGLASLALLTMGRMPADMPPATDPASRQHPRYAEVARRGKIAGVLYVLIIVAVVTLTLIFVSGV